MRIKKMGSRPSVRIRTLYISETGSGPMDTPGFFYQQLLYPNLPVRHPSA